jgi:hypothetical protein
MSHWRIGGLALMLTTGSALAQLQGPGLRVPLDTEHAVELSPGIGLRGWIGGRPGLLASDGLVASSMVLADWHPLSNGFRLSGGLAYGSLRLEPLATSGFGSERYLRDPGFNAAGLDPRSWLARGNPYLGMGWGLGAGSRSGLYFSADLGVMYQRSSLSTWGCPAGIPTALCGPDVRALDAPSGLDEARFAPMMSLGVGLRF